MDNPADVDLIVEEVVEGSSEARLSAVVCPPAEVLRLLRICFSSRYCLTAP